MALVPVGPQSPDSPTCLSRTCLRLTRWPRPLQGLRASLGRLHGCRPHSVVPAASTLPASPSVAARWTDRHMRAGGDSACRGPCAQCVPAHAAAGNLVCWRNFTDVSICFVYFLVKSKENWPLVRLTASRSLMNNGVRARRRGERYRDPHSALQAREQRAWCLARAGLPRVEGGMLSLRVGFLATALEPLEATELLFITEPMP